MEDEVLCDDSLNNKKCNLTEDEIDHLIEIGKLKIKGKRQRKQFSKQINYICSRYLFLKRGQNELRINKPTEHNNFQSYSNAVKEISNYSKLLSKDFFRRYIFIRNGWGKHEPMWKCMPTYDKFRRQCGTLDDLCEDLWDLHYTLAKEAQKISGILECIKFPFIQDKKGTRGRKKQKESHDDNIDFKFILELFMILTYYNAKAEIGRSNYYDYKITRTVRGSTLGINFINTVCEIINLQKNNERYYLGRSLLYQRAAKVYKADRKKLKYNPKKIRPYFLY
jgi:hypothetical protein